MADAQAAADRTTAFYTAAAPDVDRVLTARSRSLAACGSGAPGDGTAHGLARGGAITDPFADLGQIPLKLHRVPYQCQVNIGCVYMNMWRVWNGRR
jgi:hypothetical protein